MKKAILGKKIGMTQLFDQEGNVVPVTVIQAGPCPVVQKKTQPQTAMTPFRLALKPKRNRGLTNPSAVTSNGPMSPLSGSWPNSDWTVSTITK